MHIHTHTHTHTQTHTHTHTYTHKLRLNDHRLRELHTYTHIYQTSPALLSFGCCYSVFVKYALLQIPVLYCCCYIFLYYSFCWYLYYFCFSKARTVSLLLHITKQILKNTKLLDAALCQYEEGGFILESINPNKVQSLYSDLLFPSKAYEQLHEKYDVDLDDVEVTRSDVLVHERTYIKTTSTKYLKYRQILMAAVEAQKDLSSDDLEDDLCTENSYS